MSETNYIRINKVVIKDKSTEIKFTDYRDQDLSPAEGRYELKKSVSIPGVPSVSFEKALKKLAPHFLVHSHLAESPAAKKTVKVLSVEFKGENRAVILPHIEVEGTNLAPFKVIGPEMFIYDAENKNFKKSLEDFLAEVENFIIEKDTAVQMVI